MKINSSSKVSSLKWSAIGHILSQLISLVTNIILARLLIPSDFGQMAILSVIILLSTHLVRGGLSTSLIRTENIQNIDYSTVFLTNMVMSIVIAVLICFFSIMISDWLDDENLYPLIQLISIVIFIDGLKSIHIARLTREMNFRIQAEVQIISILLSSILAVVLAKMQYGVWALLLRSISLAILSTLLYWHKTRWFPRIKFNVDTFKKHIGFGSRLSLAAIINVVFTQSLPVLLGKFFSMEVLGYYRQSDLLANLPRNIASKIVDRVSLPIFAEVQSDKLAVAKLFKFIIQSLLILILPLVFLGVYFAHDLVLVLLSSDWLPIVPFFRILLISSLFSIIGTYCIQILKAKGRGKVFLELSLIKRAIFVFCIILGYKWGIMGLILSKAIADLINMVINIYVVNDHMKYRIIDQLRDFILPVLFMFPASLILNLVLSLIALPAGLNIFVGTMIFISCYYLSHETSKIDGYIFLRKNALSLFK